MEKKYSVAIQPPLSQIDYVKSMKDRLFDNIGNYPSRNSIAHITICEFTIDDSAIHNIKLQISKICNTFIPFQVSLDNFGTYNNVGAFYIGPNRESNDNLKLIITKTQNALRNLKLDKSINPHMSIARRLTPENLKIASQLFITVNIDFLCDRIVLREYEPHKQFFVIDTFPFGSNPQPELIQGSLF